MPLDQAMADALREACEYTVGAEKAESLDDVHEYGGRARKTLETIDRSALEPNLRQLIEDAIRHTINVQRAIHPKAGGTMREKRSSCLLNCSGSKRGDRLANPN